MIIKKLAVPLINEKLLQQVEHASIATAAISEAGFDFIRSRMLTKCKMDIVIGLEDLLQHDGYVVTVAGTCASALAQLKMQRFKAILLDPEARTCEALESPAFGKLREPFVRYGVAQQLAVKSCGNLALTMFARRL